MFPYLGAKTKIVHLYPKPKYPVIIEPFAGSAKYACKYFETPEVYLYDVNPYVTETWRYLIQATEKDILSLPIIEDGKTVNDYDLTDGEKYLIGWHLCRGKSKPRIRGYGWNGWNENKRADVAANVYKVKHFKISLLSYNDIPWRYTRGRTNIITWFIDPPYQRKQEVTTEPYLHRDIDYSKLAIWIERLPGQVIVCGGDGDDYLPFEDFTITGGTSNRLQFEQVYYQGT